MLIDRFSGWTEAFPTKHKATSMMTKKLLEDILPRYGHPQMIGQISDQVSQRQANILGID